MRDLLRYIAVLLLYDLCRSQQECDTDNCISCESCLCLNNPTELNCSHQIFPTLDGSTCELRPVRGSEREKEVILQPWMDVYREEDQPFVLEAYHQRSFKDYFRTAFNISFNNFKSTENRYRFRFRNLANPKEDLAFEFLLEKLPVDLSPGSNSVFWDCPFFNHYNGQEIELIVIDDKGYGGEYDFIVPHSDRIDPKKTALSDWQVFLILDVGLLKRQQEIVVTVQLAPFRNLTYRIELRSCHQKDACSNGTLISSEEFNDTRLDDQILPTQRTVRLDFPGAGVYIVTGQIIHDSCPTEGCYLSKSTFLNIEASSLLSYTIVCSVLFIATIILLGLLRCYKYRQLKERRTHPVSMLLVYLPETKAHYVFVETFADFLRDTCFVKTFLVDKDAVHQNPNDWTIDRMQNADRVVFLVPSDPELKSVKPVQDQFESALKSADFYIIRQNKSDKSATILIPSLSGHVPTQIRTLKRFHLMKDVTSFVTWIHNGTQLDKWLFWRSQVMSNNSKTTLKHLKSSFSKLSSENRVSDHFERNEHENSREFTVATNQQPTPEPHSSDDEGPDPLDGIFDPTIPSVGSICSDYTGSSCSIGSGFDDDMFETV